MTVTELETYTNLLGPYARDPCSCCETETDINGALVTTDDQDRALWVLCDECQAHCDRLENRAGQVNCPLDPCREDARYTRLSQRQYERWRKEIGTK